MRIDLSFKPTRISSTVRFPVGSFEVEGDLWNNGQAIVAVFGATATIRADGVDVPIADRKLLALAAAAIHPGASAAARVAIEAPPALLREIHSRRREDGAVPLRFNVSATAAEIAEHKNPTSQYTVGFPHLVNVQVGADGENRQGLIVARDRWLSILDEMGYDEIEVFELPARRLRSLPRFAAALEHLRHAEDHYRRGNPRETLASCRAAFEAATTAGAATIKQGSALLWEEVARGDDEKEKRPILDEMAGSLGAFLHLGRHARAGSPPVLEADALLALRMTLSLFEYISRRLETH